MKKHWILPVSLATIGLSLCLGCNNDGDTLTINIEQDCDTPPDNPECRCMDGTWNCPVECPGECPDNCDLNGNCVDPDVKCPDECPETCDDDGICLNAVCPDECLDNCDEYGVCIQPPVTNCPETCLDDCDDNGECTDVQYIECPEECPETCNFNGICPEPCPDECPETCNFNGLCPGTCPDECPDSCDEKSECITRIPCPEDCPADHCLNDGTCVTILDCPEDCPLNCDINGACIQPEVVCPAECPETCNENGVCPPPAIVCPAECPDSCLDDGTCPEVLTVVKALESVTGGSTKLAGKKIVVIGNSQLYKGWAVKPNQKSGGFLEKIISSYENKGATVYNYTCGFCNIAKKETYSGCKSGKPCRNDNGALGYFTKMQVKSDVNYVIASGPATKDTQIKTEMGKVKRIFPNARIVFLLQEFDYHKGNASYYKGQLAGYEIADWGKVANYFIGTSSYDRKHFILNDGRHPNLLSGFITAATAYSYLTNTSATRLKHDFFESNYSSYASDYGANTKFISVMKDSARMTKIKQKIDEVNNIKEKEVCSHAFGQPTNIMIGATLNTYGVASATCSKCGKTLRVLYTTSKPTTWNVMKIEPSAIAAAGKSTAEEYMKASLGNVFRQTGDHTWGRQGYSSISNGGMASLCDGYREKSSAHPPMSWTVKSTTEKYNADGTSGGAYVSLIGYRFVNPVTVGAFALFTANKSITSYDILGHANGAWTVLYSGNAAYHTYSSNTSYLVSTFSGWTTIDAVEIGVKTVSNKTLELMELELYGLR